MFSSSNTASCASSDFLVKAGIMMPISFYSFQNKIISNVTGSFWWQKYSSLIGHLKKKNNHATPSLASGFVFCVLVLQHWSKETKLRGGSAEGHLENSIQLKTNMK